MADDSADALRKVFAAETVDDYAIPKSDLVRHMPFLIGIWNG